VAICVLERARNVLELLGKTPHLGDRYFVDELLTRLRMLARHLAGDGGKRTVGETAGFLQLADHEAQDVELAHGAEASGDFPEPTVELVRDVSVELEHGQQLAQAPGGDTGLVDGVNVAFFDTV
jgi:hypothetical protein